MVLNRQFLLHLLGFGSLVPYFSTLKIPLAFQGHTHFKVANYRVSQVIKVNAVFRADKTRICLNATQEFYCFAFLMNICFLSCFVIYLFVCVCVSLCICECGGLKKMILKGSGSDGSCDPVGGSISLRRSPMLKLHP